MRFQRRANRKNAITKTDAAISSFGFRLGQTVNSAGHQEAFGSFYKGFLRDRGEAFGRQ